MRLPEKQIFLDRCRASAEEWHDIISSLPAVRLEDMPAENTCCVVIDMVNGFIKSGALSDERQGSLAQPVADFAFRCKESAITGIAFADTHTPDSEELRSYPPHCLAGTAESGLIPELGAAELKVFPKNSTNGFLQPDFRAWLEASPQITNFLLCGVCTDICVLQFALSLKAWFNINDRRVRIILPLALTDTYSSPGHDGDVLGAAALRMMQLNGIELVSDIL